MNPITETTQEVKLLSKEDLDNLIRAASIDLIDRIQALGKDLHHKDQWDLRDCVVRSILMTAASNYYKQPLHGLLSFLTSAFTQYCETKLQEEKQNESNN